MSQVEKYTTWSHSYMELKNADRKEGENQMAGTRGFRDQGQELMRKVLMNDYKATVR